MYILILKISSLLRTTIIIFPDKIERTVLRFLIIPVYIFAKYTKKNKLNRSKKINTQQCGGPAQNCKAGNLGYEHINACSHKNKRSQNAKEQTKTDRKSGKGKDSI